MFYHVSGGMHVSTIIDSKPENCSIISPVDESVVSLCSLCCVDLPGA